MKIAILELLACTSLIAAFVPSAIRAPQHRQISSKLEMVGSVTLFGSQGSRSPLVNWGAYEVGVPLAMAPDLSVNPHPFRQIPCLVDDESGAVVFESGAILLHLLDKVSDNIKPSDLGSIKSWIVWANASLDPICFLEEDGKVYDTGLKKPNKRIDALDDILSKQSFMMGDEFSLADVAVAAYLLYVPQFFRDIDLSRWPHVVRYMKDCASRESYGKAFGSNVQQYLITSLDAMGGDKREKLFGMF